MQVLVSLLTAVVFLAACSAPPPASANWPKGLELDLQSRSADGSASLYLVRPDGSLAWGGGFDAVSQRTSWTGPLTGEEIDQIDALLMQHEWYTREPAAEDDDEDPVYRIKLRWRGGSRSYVVHGSSPDITPVEQLLQQASRRRMEPFLQTLPKAGEQR